MALKGDTNLGGVPLEVDETIGDVLSQMDIALQFNIEARTGNVILLGDSHFASLTKDLDFPPGTFNTRQAIVSLAAGYRFAERRAWGRRAVWDDGPPCHATRPFEPAPPSKIIAARARPTACTPWSRPTKRVGPSAWRATGAAVNTTTGVVRGWRPPERRRP